MEESVSEHSASSCAAPVVVENKLIQLPQLYQTCITSSLHHQFTNTMMIFHGAILKDIKQLPELMYCGCEGLCTTLQSASVVQTGDTTWKVPTNFGQQACRVPGRRCHGTLYLQCRWKPVFNILCRLVYRLERTVLSLSISRNHSSHPNQGNTLLLGYTSLHPLRPGQTLHILRV